jgi:hypothetical protein
MKRKADKTYDLFLRAVGDVTDHVLSLAAKPNGSPLEVIVAGVIADHIATIECMSCRETELRKFFHTVRKFCGDIPLTHDCADSCSHTEYARQ